MIQVLGLRDYTHQGHTRKRETFFTKGWRFERVQDVFNPEKLQLVLDQIQTEDRFNLYFTVADCFEESGRKLKEQWAIPFDIDGLNIKEGAELQIAEKAARAAAIALEVQYEVLSVAFTGNGVQFFVHTTTPIIDEDYFERTRDAYGLLAKRIQNKLNEEAIEGTVDTSVWSKGRLMRLPMTYNRKPNKPERLSRIINEGGTAIHFDIVERSGITETLRPEVMSDTVLKNYPKPDTKAVCTGCKFLNWCKEEPNKVSEPQWYAMTSITARLDNGRELTHAYSEKHQGYNHYETENKIDQSLAASGPRTCKDIDTRWDGCKDCDYHGKVTSPIMIKGEDYIASKDFGFRERKQVGEGQNVRVIPGRPVYTDLIKAFTYEHPYKLVNDNGQVIIFNGKHWQWMPDNFINAWATRMIKPEPSGAEMREFLTQLKAYNVTSLDELNQQKSGYMNFQNVVLNMRTGEVFTHAPEYGFFEVRPYSYDSRAKAPTWDKFLLDIMADDADMVAVLREFAGYAISGDPCWLQKALLLVGDGANGKSVFMEILGEVVGREAHGAVPMQELEKDTMRFHLLNKLFNYSEETSMRALSDSSMFKTLVSGGLVAIKQLYAQPFIVPNTAKIIMSANNMPYSVDKSGGLLRRLAIVNFNIKFEPGDGKHDYFIKDKLRAELPGICNSLIAAYKDLKARGVLPADAKLKENVTRYQEESDTVLMFINDVMVEQEGSLTKTSEVYEEYRRMCEMREFKPVNHIVFGKHLAKHRPGCKSKVVNFAGTHARAYENIKLNKEY